MNRKNLCKIVELYALSKQEFPDKKCGDCAMCEKLQDGSACCEVYGFVTNGFVPVDVTPPYDTACGMYNETEKICIDGMMD